MSPCLDELSTKPSGRGACPKTSAPNRHRNNAFASDQPSKPPVYITPCARCPFSRPGFMIAIPEPMQVHLLPAGVSTPFHLNIDTIVPNSMVRPMHYRRYQSVYSIWTCREDATRVRAA